MAELLRLLVDARPLDHPLTRSRGIGRYTAGLLRGLHDIGAPVTALCSSDAEVQAVQLAAPGLDIAPWSAGTIRAATAPGIWYLATQLMVHPIPLDPVPRVITEAGLPVAAVMYDVIPERHPERYQQRPEARAQVQLRGILTRTLDALLAISNFSAVTAADVLRFPPDRILPIGAGVEARFTTPTGDPWPSLARLALAGSRHLVVTVTSWDERKNLQRLLLAWGAVPAAVRADHRLVVVGAHDPDLLSQWSGWAAAAGVEPEMCFTGSVTDDEMIALYQVARLSVMPSVDEGFGLPVLEAAACGCPSITSATSALPEVLAEPTSTFDPLDPSAMARAIERALTDEAHRARLCDAARRAAERCTWAATARAAVDGLRSITPRPRTLRAVPRRVAVAGRFDGSSAGAANTAFVARLRAHPDAPIVTQLYDTAATIEPVEADGQSFHIRALGRYLPTSQFDRLLAIVTEPSAAMATFAAHDRVDCWLHSDESAVAEWLATIAHSILADDADAVLHRLCEVGIRPTVSIHIPHERF